MSLVSLADVKEFLGIAVTDNSQDDVITFFHEGMEAWASDYCLRELESTSYTRELYDGNGDTVLYLRNYPVTAIIYVSTSRDNAIKIKNTSTDASYATVNISSTTLTLTVSGGDNEDATNLLFADYATLTLLVAAINAVGKGWDAALVLSDYASIKSTELLETHGLYCGSRSNTTASYEYLDIAGDPISEFRLRNSKAIYYPYGFTNGTDNIIVSYTAGYTTTTLPNDLKLALLQGIKFLFQQHEEDREGVTDFSISGFMSTKLEQRELPKIVLDTLLRYQRIILA